jgi:hypothetical protein
MSTWELYKRACIENQRINNELLQRGSTTFGTLERRKARLQRFIEYEKKIANVKKHLNVIIAEQRRQIETRQKSRAAQEEAAWTLLSLKTERIQPGDYF